MILVIPISIIELIGLDMGGAPQAYLLIVQGFGSFDEFREFMQLLPLEIRDLCLIRWESNREE